MQPFFNKTRASMIFCPTMKCRCSSGFRSSIGTVRHGMYCSFALGPTFNFVCAFFLEAGFVRFRRIDGLAISVHLPLVDSNRVIVQISVRQLQRLGFADLAFRNHLRERGGQGCAARLHPQPVALFRA